VGGFLKMKTYRIYLVAIIAILCTSGIVDADSAFRCGTQLVSLKDTRDDVLRICGDPSSVDSWVEERILRDFRSVRDYDPRTGRDEWNREPFLVKVQVNVELWTYNLGSTQFIRYLRFENGIIKEINSGNKGY
jgi:hypothetical protein